jgi:LysM repeat protein
VAWRRSSLTGCLVATLLAVAGCSARDEPVTPTSDDFFVIVTQTPGTPPAEMHDVARPTRYTVQEGDNLSDIANELGVPMQDLQDANGIENPDNIYTGQILIVPTPEP